MRHIHPFPARMAPEIALSKIDMLPNDAVILDPMCGSGMVLAQAARKGVFSIGFDLDPLANLISRVGSQKINEACARKALVELLKKAEELHKKRHFLRLPWIDNDEETLKFVDFWFASKQKNQLRILSHLLVNKPFCDEGDVIDLLKVAVSRLIITKEPKASLARDTAHSRPHKTITCNDFDVFCELPKSLDHVLKALQSDAISKNSETYLGDARNLTELEDNSVDAIITSPPYLNAIDYMRGHRLSLVWWGYSMSELREIRSTSIGAERMISEEVTQTFESLAEKLDLKDVSSKNYNMLWRYFLDLTAQTAASARVLKKGGTAMYVIGNSNIKGVHIKNSELLKAAASVSHLKVISEKTREIPNNRRYLPISVHSKNSLATRMRTEHIIEFQKSN